MDKRKCRTCQNSGRGCQNHPCSQGGGSNSHFGMNSTSGGVVLFMNVNEIVVVNNINFYNIDCDLSNKCAPIIKSVGVTNQPSGTPAPSVVIPDGDTISRQNIQFALIPGLLSSNIIPSGMWDMHIWVRTAQAGIISLQWTLYFQDEDGIFTPNPFAVSERVTITTSSLTSSSELILPLYISSSSGSSSS